MRVSSLFLPLISPSAMSWLMAPSSALSTAPVPPPGLLTPSNRLTITAFAGCRARSPFSTFISTGTPFSFVHRHHRHGRCGGQSRLLLDLAFLLYFAVRGAVVDRPETAYRHALDVIDAQRSLGIFWEDDMNDWIKDRQFLAQTANIVYFWLHFPLIIAFGIYLYYGQRSKYTLMRDAFLLSGAIALVVYFLYPVAPPRELPELAMRFDNGGPGYVRGFFDTMQGDPGYGDQGPAQPGVGEPPP